MTDNAGNVIVDRYRLVQMLGEGGMGAAWRAWDERMRRDVVLKQLKVTPALGSERRRQLVARMEREARAAGMLKHPAIITVYDQFHDQDGLPWIVMEFVRGPSLADLIDRDGPVAEIEVARIGAQIAAALAAAHEAGIVHRDIKPANVLLEGERVVVTDFGIAAVAGEVTLTAEGILMGTPVYMAPEQIKDYEATSASDMWSLGATLYTAVEGRRPFTATNTPALLLAVVSGKPTATTRAHLLKPLLLDLMNPDPGRRPAASHAATALQQAMQQAGHPHPTAPQSFQAVPDSPGPAKPGPRSTPRPRPLVNRSRLLAGLGAAGLVVALTASAYILAQDETQARQDTSEWRNPVQFGKAFTGHTGSVTEVAFSPNGKTLATRSEDNTVQLWDVASRTQIGKALAGHSGSVTEVAFSPNGEILATSGEDGTVRLWRVASRTQIGRPLIEHPGRPATEVAFSPDSEILATVSNDRTVRLWDVASRTQIGKALAGHSGPVTEVAFSPKGETLATSSEDGTVRLWRVASRTQIGKALAGHTAPVTELGFSANGQTLASGSNDRTVRLWRVASRTQIGAPIASPTGFYSLAVSSDGKTLATGGTDATVRLWDVASRVQIGDPIKHQNSRTYSLVFSPDGKTLATGGTDKTVRLWRSS